MAWWRSRRTADDADRTGRKPRTPQQRTPIPSPRSAEGRFGDTADGAVRADGDGTARRRGLEGIDPGLIADLDRLTESALEATSVRRLSTDRLAEAMKRLKIRYLTDEKGSLLAMWERHVLQVGCEGPAGEILVLRARAYATVPPEWVDRAYTAVNEWNRTRRFLKAYVGAETESGNHPLYGEVQLPLVPGLHDALLDEIIDCAAAVSGAWVDWLYDDGGVL